MFLTIGEKMEEQIIAEETKIKVEHWGDPHEYLNGKHIKDWEGKMLAMLEVFTPQEMLMMVDSIETLKDATLKAIRRSVSNGNGN